MEQLKLQNAQENFLGQKKHPFRLLDNRKQLEKD